jgi:predicted DNA binding protein
MSLILEWTQSAPYVKITDVPPKVPEMDLTLERWRIEPNERVSGFITADGTDFETFERELEGLSSVAEFSLISELHSARLYQVRFVSKTQHFPEYSGVRGVINEIKIRSDGLQITAHFPNREEVVKLYEFLESEGMEVETNGLYRTRKSSPTSDVSDKQKEALFTAYERGYYDVPRETTLSDLADELDVAPSSLSGRLKRAQKHLVEAAIRQEQMFENLE